MKKSQRKKYWSCWNKIIKVLEILKAPKFETLICNIDKDGRTDKIKLIYENSSEIVEKFRIYKPLTCFSDRGVEYIDIYRTGCEKIIEIIFI